MSAELLITLEDAGVAFGPTRVLSAVDAQVRAGDYVSITGRSGSGKSTLLNLIAGTVFPTEGQVHVAGHDMATTSGRLAAQRHAIGYLFQAAHLVGWMSAADNVALGMRYQGVARRERRARALEALEQVGLAQRATHRPAQLSGGERQRVALARAIARRPVVLLADEPTGNLDAETGAQVIELLERVGAGRALVLITHDSVLAERGSRRWSVERGHLVQDGAWAEQLAQPVGTTPAVASAREERRQGPGVAAEALL